MKDNSRAFLLLFMGVLTAFGPFVTDMYLPTLPSMTEYFSTSMSQVQLGLTFSMLGLALGQLGFGPLSDKIGRRHPLLISMAIFVASTLACIFSPNIEFFLGMPFYKVLLVLVALLLLALLLLINSPVVSWPRLWLLWELSMV